MSRVGLLLLKILCEGDCYLVDTLLRTNCTRILDGIVRVPSMASGRVSAWSNARYALHSLSVRHIDVCCYALLVGLLCLGRLAFGTMEERSRSVCDSMPSGRFWLHCNLYDRQYQPSYNVAARYPASATTVLSLNENAVNAARSTMSAPAGLCSKPNPRWKTHPGNVPAQWYCQSTVLMGCVVDGPIVRAYVCVFKHHETFWDLSDTARLTTAAAPLTRFSSAKNGSRWDSATHTFQ